VKAVIDTNVLVSALMKRGSPPESVVVALGSDELVALYDQRILQEYREVLARPTLKRIQPPEASELLKRVVLRGVEVIGARCPQQLPDPDDQPFADVAFTGKADLLITGNIRHFLPAGDLIRVVTPRQWLDLQASLEGE
jgi:uncharacterized protein